MDKCNSPEGYHQYRHRIIRFNSIQLFLAIITCRSPQVRQAKLEWRRATALPVDIYWIVTLNLAMACAAHRRLILGSLRADIRRHIIETDAMCGAVAQE